MNTTMVWYFPVNTSITICECHRADINLFMSCKITSWNSIPKHRLEMCMVYKTLASTHRSRKSRNTSVLYPPIYYMCTFLFQSGVLWDMGQVRCGICEIGQLQLLCLWMVHKLSTVVANTHAVTDYFYHICFLTDYINTELKYCCDHEPQY